MTSVGKNKVPTLGARLGITVVAVGVGAAFMPATHCVAGATTGAQAPSGRPSGSPATASKLRAGKTYARVMVLIARLSSSEYGQRQKAKKGLLMVGRPALPMLRQAAKGYGPAQTRIRKLMAAIELRVALSATRVTIHMSHGSALVVLRRIARLAKTTFKLRSSGLRRMLAAKRIDFNVDNMPFWAALTKFNNQTGLCLDASKSENSTDNSVDLYRARHGGGLVLCKGPWALQLNNILMTNAKRIGTPTGQNSEAGRGTVFNFNFYAQPGIPFSNVDISIVKITRGKDKPYLEPVPASPPGGPVFGSSTPQMMFVGQPDNTFGVDSQAALTANQVGASDQLTLNIPHQHPKTFETLVVDATPTFYEAGRTVTIQKPVGAKGVAETFGGLRVRFIGCVPLPNGRYRATVKVTGTDWQAAGINRGMELLAAGGRAYLNSGNSTTGTSAAGETVQVSFTPPISLKTGLRQDWKPAKLVIWIPSAKRTETVRFTLHNIPVPH